jgi:hypothetical protein
MTPISPTIRLMTYEEADNARLNTRGLILEHHGNSYRLNAGTSDTVRVYQASLALYVLTLNRSLGYLGLDAYVPADQDPINTVFLHSEHVIKETLGAHWHQMSACTITRRLINFLI